MIVYLASPYSDKDDKVKEQRFNSVCRVASILMQRGMHIYSPIAHSHPIARFGLPGGWDFWEEYDRKFLAVCGQMLVLTIPGWKESIGVQSEIRIAAQMSIPVYHIDEGGNIFNIRIQ